MGLQERLEIFMEVVVHKFLLDLKTLLSIGIVLFGQLFIDSIVLLGLVAYAWDGRRFG